MNPPSPILIKIGGSLMESDRILEELCSVLAQYKEEGHSLILVHGGGKDINRHLAWLDEEPVFVNGLRVTSEAGMKIVEMTLSGLINKKLAGLLNKHGALAVGISGVDGPTLICKSISSRLGRVGSVSEVRTGLLTVLLSSDFLPVVSPVSVDESWRHFNVNADDAAGALAAAIGAKKLFFLSDVEGVWDGEGKRIPNLDKIRIEELISLEIATGGMIPKLYSCLTALEKGIGEVHICGWQGREAFLDQIRGTRNSGTVIARQVL